MKNTVTFAVQVLAMIGNKEAQAAVREEMIRAAILTAVKGNATPWLEGMGVAVKGKGAIAAALVQGFHAVGMIAVHVKPQEQITASERAERNNAETDRLLDIFMGAFKGALPKEATKEEKEAAKAEREAAKATAQTEAIEAAIKERGLVRPDQLLTQSDILAQALEMLKAGKAGNALADEFRDALGVPSMLAQSFADGKAAGLAEAAEAQAKAAIASASAAPKRQRTKKAAEAQA